MSTTRGGRPGLQPRRFRPATQTLFLRGSRLPGSDVVTGLLDRLDEDTPGLRIRCPHCGWVPGSSDRWFCGSEGPPERYAGCGTSWNTFRTRGRCPGCDHQWQWTACLACGGWARHEEWYESDEGDAERPAG
jgi:hypothetical protein